MAWLDGIDSPAVSVEIDTSSIGGFVWDISAWDGDDLWDGDLGEWTAVAAVDVTQVGIRRGRSREDQAIQPGTLTVTLDNRSGDYSSDNESSPWRWNGESLMSRGIGVRVLAGFRSAADIEAERLLRSAVLFLDSHNPGPTPTVSIKNLGTGGVPLNAALASGSNSPKWLPYTGTPHVYLPGVAGNSLSVPDQASFNVTDLDVRVRVSLDDWTPLSVQTLASQTGAGAINFAWDFRISASGAPSLRYSLDGTTILSNIGSGPSPALVDGVGVWWRCTRVASTGQIIFYTAPDQATEPATGAFAQVGSPVAGTSGALFDSTAVVALGTYAGTGQPAAGKFYRCLLKSGIAGSSILDIDTSVVVGSSTTFLATTGQTVTINRSTAGRKATCVASSKWLFGTDDYMEVPDNALLDFNATDPMTVLFVDRIWATPTNNGVSISKFDTTGAGWRERGAGTTVQDLGGIGDGTNTANHFGPATGALSSLGVHGFTLDRTARLLTAYLNGVAASTPASTSTIGDLTNALAMRIGRQGGVGTAAYRDMEFVAALVFRRVLTPTEIATISSYMTTRAAVATELETLFRGYIESVDADQGDNPVAVLTASDALAVIAPSQIEAIAANYAGDTTAARIGRILDAVNWDAELRDLTGTRTMLDTTYGATALSLADEAVGCEYGVFYSSKDGILTAKPYEDAFDTTLRFQLSDDPDSGLLSYSALTTKPSTEYLVNDVKVVANAIDYTATNDYSIALRKTKVSRTFNAPLDSGPQAQALADLILDRLSANTVRADSIEINCAGITVAEWTNLLQAELRERAEIHRTTVDGRTRLYNCIIESLNIDISPYGWTEKMNLSPGIGGAFFVWDASLWDGDDRWYY